MSELSAVPNHNDGTLTMYPENATGWQLMTEWITTDTVRFQELMDREPAATPSQIVAEALEFYAVSDKPWVTLAEGRELGEVPAHE